MINIAKPNVYLRCLFFFRVFFFLFFFFLGGGGGEWQVGAPVFWANFLKTEFLDPPEKSTRPKRWDLPSHESTN